MGERESVERTGQVQDAHAFEGGENDAARIRRFYRRERAPFCQAHRIRLSADDSRTGENDSDIPDN
jgi:hypothetical protein